MFANSPDQAVLLVTGEPFGGRFDNDRGRNVMNGVVGDNTLANEVIKISPQVGQRLPNRSGLVISGN